MAIQRVAYILQLILLHQASYVSLRSMIGRWNEASAVIVASAIEWAREKMQQIIDAVNRLFFLVRWIHGQGEIALLYAEVRRRKKWPALPP